MSARLGYYLPLAADLFEEVRFLGISEKIEGVGDDAQQRHDKNGTPVWGLPRV